MHKSAAASALAVLMLSACGGSAEDPEGTSAAPPAGVTLTCNTANYVAGSVEVPTATQVAAYAATYNGDEGSYTMGGSFTRSGTATLVLGGDASLRYGAVAYTVKSLCLDKTAGPYGRILYVEVGAGKFDISDRIDATLGQAWGVSPANGSTIFTNGRRP